MRRRRTDERARVQLIHFVMFFLAADSLHFPPADSRHNTFVVLSADSRHNAFAFSQLVHVIIHLLFVQLIHVMVFLLCVQLVHVIIFSLIIILVVNLDFLNFLSISYEAVQGVRQKRGTRRASSASTKSVTLSYVWR